MGGGAVLIAANGQLTSYHDRTGQVRWTEALRPWIQLDSSSMRRFGRLTAPSAALGSRAW